MMPNCKHSEEKVIDFILGKLPEEDAAAFRDHILHCPVCKEKQEEWDVLLREGSDVPQPSPVLKERIQRNAHREGQPKKMLIRPRKVPAQKVPVHLKSVLAALGTAAVLLLGVTLYQTGTFSNQDVKQDYIVTQDQTIGEQSTVVQDPRTVELNIVPVAMENIEGNVWVNDSTHEMLLKVDGLMPLFNNDYQVWLIRSNDHFNGGVLREQNGRGFLYFRGVEPRQFEHIRVSIEPKGGSVTPTGPDTFFVRLKNE